MAGKIEASMTAVHPQVAEGQGTVRYPVQQRYAPLLIAGGGEQRTLRQ